MTISAASSVGSATLSTPTMAMLPGISMMTPIDTVMSGGVPQPSFAIGPMRKRAFVRREDGAQVADDARRVLDRVLREHDAVDGAGAHALDQRRQVHRAVEAEQPAEADAA